MSEKASYHVQKVDIVVEKLNTHVSNGLTSEEANNRITQYGLNELPSEKSKTVLEKIWEQINSILIYVLLVGAALSFGFEHYADGFVIIGVIVVNVSLGYFMEEQAESSTRKLKSLLSPMATVIRDGEKVEIDATNVTLGDIFEVKVGDIVPADGRVVKEANLNVLEAALTGEAHAVKKTVDPVEQEDTPLAERYSMVYSGTQIIKGNALCVATAIGSECEIGKINALLRGVEEVKTPLVIQLEVFGYYLSAGILLVSIIALGVSFGRGYSVDDAFSFAIGIAVAAIPEGLPSVVTITFSIGVYTMAKNQAIVKTLPAVEALGSVSVICSDKTGTLTQNKMKVKVVITQDHRLDLTDGGKIQDDDSESGKEFNEAEKFLPLLIPGIICNDSILRKKEEMHSDGKENTKQSVDIEMGNPNAEEPSFTVEGSPTEACIMNLAGHWVPFPEIKSWLSCFPRADVFPFDSANKYMATCHTIPSQVPQSFPGGDFLPNNVTRNSPSDSSNDSETHRLAFLKGAPERVVSFCDFHDPQQAQYWKDQAHALAAAGMRVIALAYRLLDLKQESNYDFKKDMESPTHFHLISLVGIIDPPRPEAIIAIDHAQHAGIIVKMITGDHPVTAKAIAEQLGLQHNQRARDMQSALAASVAEAAKTGDRGSVVVDEEDIEITDRDSVKDPDIRAITGNELDRLLAEEEKEQRSNRRTSSATEEAETEENKPISRSTTSNFAKTVANYDVFARTTPEHKLRIVQSLQAQGFICSMTGDGVNDSPALKAASIGVAMGITGTEVAKDAAKIILLDDNFKTIVEAIRLGRCTYQNLIKILTFVLPTNAAQAFSIVAALIIGFEVPITALQILWVNMVTSITLGLVLAFEPVDDRVMFHPPRKTHKRIFGSFLRYRVSAIALLFIIIILGNFNWEKIERDIRDIDELRTIAVNTLTGCQVGYLFNCRFLRQNEALWETFTGNGVIFLSIILVAGLQVLFTYAPFMQYVFQTKALDGIAWGKIAMWSVVVFILVEFEKFLAPNWHSLVRVVREGSYTKTSNEEDPSDANQAK